MPGFVKLHSAILESSVWGLPHATVRVWIAMLVMADADGIVWASLDGLAHRARVTIEECEQAVACFLGPDRHSRDQTTGERIEAVPGGWLVLNHANYRATQTREQAMTSERVAKHREKRAALRGVTGRYEELHEAKKRHTASASVTSASGIAGGESARGEDVLEGFSAFWEAYDKKVGRHGSERAWRKLKPDASLVATIVDRASAYAASTPDKQYRRHPSTWLNGRHWEDEIVERTTSSDRIGAVPKSIPLSAYSTTKSPTDWSIG